MLLGARNQKQTGLEHLTNPQSYDLLQKRQKQKQLLDLINEKDQTIIVLHQINTRIGAELSILQRKLGIDSEQILHELQNLKQISVGFHYELDQLQYLDSLFKSYDENNIKQKKLIAMLYSQLEDSEKKAENLVRDNEFLLNEMQTKCKQILQIYQRGFPEDNLIETYNKLQRETQVSMIQSLRQQNQYLTRYCSEMQEKYLRLQVDYDEAKTATQKYFSTYKSQSQQLKQAFIKVDDLTKVKQVLQKKFDEISQENIQLQSMKQLLQGRVVKLEQELKRSRNEFFASKRNNKQQTEKSTVEIESLRMQLETVSKRQRQGFNKLMIYQRENESLKQQNRQLKRQTQKSKADFQNTIKMLEAYETKTINNQKKMQAMQQLLQQTKDNFDGSILDKEKALLKIEHLQKQNQSLRQKHIDQSSQLKISFERIITNLNQKIQMLENEKEQLNDYSHQQQVTIKNEQQKLKRINQQLRNENHNLLQSIKTNSGSDIINKIRDLEQKNENVNKQLMMTQRQLLEQKQMNEEIIDNLKQEIKDLSRQLEKQRHAASNYINELTRLKSNLSIVNSEMSCKENELTKLKKLLDQKTYSHIEQKDWKVKDLEQKLQQALNRQKKIRAQAIEKLQKYDQTQRQLEMQYRNIISGLEKEIQELKRKLRKARGGRDQ